MNGISQSSPRVKAVTLLAILQHLLGLAYFDDQRCGPTLFASVAHHCESGSLRFGGAAEHEPLVQRSGSAIGLVRDCIRAGWTTEI